MHAHACTMITYMHVHVHIHAYFIICTMPINNCYYAHTQSQINARVFKHIKVNYLRKATTNVGTLHQFICTPRDSPEMRDAVHALLNGSCMQILDCF